MLPGGGGLRRARTSWGLQPTRPGRAAGCVPSSRACFLADLGVYSRIAGPMRTRLIWRRLRRVMRNGLTRCGRFSRSTNEFCEIDGFLVRICQETGLAGLKILLASASRVKFVKAPTVPQSRPVSGNAMVLATVKVRSSPCSPCSGGRALRAAARGSGSPLTFAARHVIRMGSGRKASRRFSPFASGAGRTEG
jgi:hypothetical protein